MEPEKTAPVLAHGIYIAPLPPREWRRATAAARRWWRRLWRIDMGHLTDGWTELGYIEDDGIDVFLAEREEEISRIASITETPEIRLAWDGTSDDTLALMFGGDAVHVWQDPTPVTLAGRDEALRRLADAAMISRAALRRYYGLPPVHRDDERPVDGETLAGRARTLLDLPRPAHLGRHRATGATDILSLALYRRYTSGKPRPAHRKDDPRG